MILDKEVEICISGCNAKHFKNLGYEFEYGKKIFVKVKDLQQKSNAKINVQCDVCSNKKKISYNKYNKNTKSFTEIYCCSEKCAVEKQKKTCMERYGVENPSCLEEFKDKIRKTNLGKYGVENPSCLEEFKDKIRKTNLEKYGVEVSTKNKNVYEKTKKTNLEKYGFENCLQNEEIKNKSLKTLMKNYDVDTPLKNKKIYEKYQNTMLEKYGENHNSKLNFVKDKKVETCLKNHGVKYPMQSQEVFEKGIKTRIKIHKYNTELTYQGSYEKYFLELMEERGMLHEVSKGKTYKYLLNNKEHFYHSDYLFRGITVEIKSSWTYNKNGKDKYLELENETKWQATKDFGDEIIVLFSKKEIKKYVYGL